MVYPKKCEIPPNFLGKNWRVSPWMSIPQACQPRNYMIELISILNFYGRQVSMGMVIQLVNYDHPLLKHFLLNSVQFGFNHPLLNHPLGRFNESNFGSSDSQICFLAVINVDISSTCWWRWSWVRTNALGLFIYAKDWHWLISVWCPILVQNESICMQQPLAHYIHPTFGCISCLLWQDASIYRHIPGSRRISWCTPHDLYSTCVSITHVQWSTVVTQTIFNHRGFHPGPITY